MGSTSSIVAGNNRNQPLPASSIQKIPEAPSPPKATSPSKRSVDRPASPSPKKRIEVKPIDTPPPASSSKPFSNVSQKSRRRSSASDHRRRSSTSSTSSSGSGISAHRGRSSTTVSVRRGAVQSSSSTQMHEEAESPTTSHYRSIIEDAPVPPPTPPPTQERKGRRYSEAPKRDPYDYLSSLEREIMLLIYNASKISGTYGDSGVAIKRILSGLGSGLRDVSPPEVEWVSLNTYIIVYTDSRISVEGKLSITLSNNLSLIRTMGE